MVSSCIHTTLCQLEMLSLRFLQNHIKSLTKNHVLAEIEGKDLAPKFFWGMVLGVKEGQSRGDYFLDCIFDPSVNHCNAKAQPVQ